MKASVSACAFCCCLPVLLGAAPLPAEVDVLVLSANPAGIGALIAAAEQGASVLAVEPLTMIGGMGAAGGVGLMNQVCNARRPAAATIATSDTPAPE